MEITQFQTGVVLGREQQSRVNLVPVGSIDTAHLAPVVAQALNPAGTIIEHGAAGTPAGYLPCDGSVISRTTYANLFAAISDKWGVGNGTTTFSVPDLRGRFSRMKDLGAGRDIDSRTPLGTGAASDVGSVQSDVFGSHNHGIGNFWAEYNSVYDAQGGGGAFPPGIGPATAATQGGSETRPKNAYVMKYIKY